MGNQMRQVSLTDFFDWYEEHKKKFLSVAQEMALKNTELLESFLQKWPLERLLDMELDDYIQGKRKGTFCYDIEHGPYKELFMGIKGGAAGKFGIYWSKDKQAYCGENNQPINDEDVFIKFNKLKTDLYNLIKTSLACDFDNSIFSETNSFYGKYAVTTKLLCIYSKGKLFAGVNMNNYHKELWLPLLSPSVPINHVYQLNHAVRQKIGQRLPELKVEYIDTYLWKYKEEFEKNNSEVRKNLTMTTNYRDKLQSSKNIILRGAPGTGKTYLARQIAAEMIGCSKDELNKSEQFGFVQFHPNYDYTDFVEGLRPVKTDNDSIAFERRNGIFMDFCERAKTNLPSLEGYRSYLIKSNVSNVKVQQYVTHIQYLLGEKEYSGKKHIEIIQFNSLVDIVKNSEEIKGFDRENDFHNYFLTPVNYLQEYFQEEGNRKFIFIIDEINRGDMAKIFGELFFSLDPGYRGKTGAVTTQFANLYDGSEGKNPGDKFYIPENVYIIGTMNDIDRSVDSFDFAMRRRFRFIEITAESQLGMFNSDKEFKTEHIEEAKRRLQNLNQQISKTDELNANYHIGPSYFLNLKEINYDYEILWSDYLEPLLAEYLRGMYGEEDKLGAMKAAYHISIGEDDVANR